MTTTLRTPARILIVDDHPIVRQGYSQLIGNHSDLVVCGSVPTEQEAMEQVDSTRPHLVIVDISLGDGSGIDLVKEIHARDPGLKLLVISAHDENLYAERALEAGAMGYVNKQEATDKLIDAIRRVLAGEVYLSDDMTSRVLRRQVARGKSTIDRSNAIDALTDRELQVFEQIGRGRTTKQIAELMELSAKTIERYKENIKRKLDLANATELIQQATRWVIDGK